MATKKKFEEEFFFIKKIMPVVIIIGLASLWMRFDVGYSSPHSREYASLYGGRALLHGIMPERSDFVQYSLAGAAFSAVEDFMGAVGARVFSDLIGLLSIFLFYRFSLEITKDKTAAALSAILLALTASHIFISKSATAEIAAFALFAWAATYGARIVFGSAGGVKPAAIGSALYLAATLCWLPLAVYAPIFAIVLLASKRSKEALIFLAVAVGGLLIFSVIDSSLWGNLYGSLFPFTNIPSRWTRIAMLVLQYVSLPLILWYALWEESYKFETPKRTLGALLALSSPLVLLNFVQPNENFLSSDFNAYYLFALAPLGLIFKDFLRSGGPRRITAIVFLFIFAGIAYYHTTQLERSFPNSKIVGKLLEMKVTRHSKILAEDAYLPLYYFYPVIPRENFYDFATESQKGVMEANVRTGYYTFVLPTGLATPDETVRLREKYIRNLYAIVYKQDFINTKTMNGITDGKLEIYQRLY
ncbi:MAG: hypothetical protein ACM3U1_01160 [Chloroflexota bacterium]